MSYLIPSPVRRVRLFFGLALALLVVILCASMWTTTRLRDAARSAARAFGALEAATEAHLEVNRAENFVRSYLDGGGPASLAGRRAAEEALRSRLATLRRLLQDDPAGQRRHDRIAAAVRDSAELNDRIIARKAAGRPTPAELVEWDTAMVSCRRQVHALINEVSIANEGAGLAESVRWAQSNAAASLYINGIGGLIGIGVVGLAAVGAMRDLRARHRDQQALRLGEERFRGAFDAAVIGMALVDPEGRWSRVNHALCQIVNYTELELLGSTFQSITHPDDVEADRKLMRRLLDAEIDSCQLEKRFFRKGGEVVWGRLSVTVARELGGQPLNFVVLVEDVTPRRRAEGRAAALHKGLEEAYEATIAGWARALDLRDHETEGHCRRVTEVTLRLAQALGLPEADLVHVRRGALLHDIGKMGIPDAILLKPGKLTEGEWEVMRRHPELAVEMLSPIEFLRPALDIPHYHHEKWDGTGYPRGLAGEEIPLAARAFAIVDIWDALTHDRPYRAAWTADRALDHLKSLAGTHLDPAVVVAFLDLASADRPGVSGPPPGPADAGAAPLGEPRPRPSGLDTDALADPARLAALRATGLLDSPVDPSFDRLVRLASKVLRAPVSLVCLVDDRRQFFKSSCGLPEPWSSLRETPMSHSFCREVVRSAAPLVVADARLDPRVRDNRAIAELGVIAYAGMPLTTSAGYVLGSFCVIDVSPRPWAEEELGILRDLAASVMTAIEHQGDLAARRRVEDELRRSRRRVADQLRIATGLNRELVEQRREMALANGRLAEMAETDGLTGMKNRRHFDRALANAHTNSSVGGTPLSIILADVDEFKRYNDAFGHPAGDGVLRDVAEALAGQLRGLDLVARYGGEEFVILLPDTDAAAAGAMAERLRVAVEARPWRDRRVTASFGVATSVPGEDGPWALVDQADEALYLSKESVRVFASDRRKSLVAKELL